MKKCSYYLNWMYFIELYILYMYEIKLFTNIHLFNNTTVVQ